MIYEGRLVTVIRGMEKEWASRVLHQFFPELEKRGARPMGVFQTVIGNSQDFYIVIQFDNLAHREKVFAAMAKDPAWQKVEEAWLEVPTIANIYTSMIKPVTPPKPNKK